MKLVHYLQWEGDAVASLAPQFPDVRFVKAASAEQAAQELVDADILIVAGPYYPGAVAHAVNGNAPKLRWMQASSIGTDKFEQGGVPENVIFTSAAGLKGRTVAEHAMALMLGHIHALPQMERFRTALEWGRDALRTEISCLEEQTLLLLGYGSIGREIARKAKAFDMNVVALNSSGEGDGPADTIAPLRDLANWLPDADFVACSLPLTPDTDKLIGHKEYSIMKKSAVLVNVGRGAVIDHAALLQALQTNVIAGACLDVFEQEPLPLDDEFWQLPNVILSPHVAGTGGPLGRRFADLISENLVRLCEGQPLKNAMRIGGS